MTFDDVLSAIIVLLFGAMFYLAGKGDVLNLIPLILIDKAKSLTETPIETVVRCKDCTVPHDAVSGCPLLNGLVTDPEFFCANGVREGGK